MTVQKLTDANFNYATNGKWLVFFSAPWAGPCNLVRSTFERIARQTNSVSFAEFCLDDNPTIPERYGVRQLPTFISFDNGVPVIVKAGAIPEERLIEMIDGFPK